MPLTVVCGPPNAGKTGVLHDVIQAALRDSRSPVMLVPSRSEAEYVSRRLSAEQAYLGLRITVFDDYVDELWALHGDGRPVISAPVRATLLANAIRATPMRCLADSSTGTGFLRILLPLAAGLPSDAVGAVVTGGVGGDIAGVLAHYLDSLEREGLVERSAAVERLVGHAERAWFDGPLVANRFGDLTPAQERFLVAMAGVRGVWLALPWQESFPATRALDPLVGRLAAAGASISHVRRRSYTASEELRRVEERLFLPDHASGHIEPRGDVRLSEAYGSQAEAARILSEATEALREGTPAPRIGVVFANVAAHADDLDREFRAAGVPARFDVVRPARDSGWGRALALLGGFVTSGSRSDLLAFLRSGYAAIDSEVLDALERSWRRSRVVERAPLLASLQRSCAGSARLVRLAGELLNAPVTDATATRWQDLADSLLANGLGRMAPVLDRDGLLDVAAHRTLLRVVDGLTSMTAPLAQGRDLVDAFLQESVAAPYGPDDGIHVLSAERARARRFEVVIIGGLTAGDFSEPPSDGALSSPNVVSAAESLGVHVRDTSQDDERLLFYLVASRATRRLVLSRQIASSDGAPLRASWLLEEFLDLYRPPSGEETAPESLPPRTLLVFDDAAAIESHEATHRRLLRAAARGRGEVTTLNPDDAARVKEARRRATPRKARLTSESALSWLSEREVFSATEIEAYLRCPYSWFHRRVVRARPLEVEADARALGSLAHDALKRIFERLPSETGAPRVASHSLVEAVTCANRVVDEVLEEYGEARTLGEQAACTSLRRKVVGFVRADATFLPGFDPVALELDFPEDAGVFDQFRLAGRIDRIDQGPGGEIVVVDYKTGAVDSSHSKKKFADKGLVQLGLYASVASRLFGAPVAAALYRKVAADNVSNKLNRGFFGAEVRGSAGLVSNDLLLDGEFDEIVKDAERRSSHAVAGMRAGAIPAEPLDERSCDRCELARLCPRWS